MTANATTNESSMRQRPKCLRIEVASKPRRLWSLHLINMLNSSGKMKMVVRRVLDRREEPPKGNVLNPK